MQLHKVCNNYNCSFNASLTLKHSGYDNKSILSEKFVKYYSNIVDKLGKKSDTVKITVQPRYQNYIMDVEVVRNNEKYKKAQSLLLCPNIKEALPDFLLDEYKWLVSWFKDKNGTAKD